MFCSKCGEELKEGAKFCQKCGAPVNAQGQAPAQNVAPQQVQNAAVQPVQYGAPKAAPVPAQYAAYQPMPMKNGKVGVGVGSVIMSSIFALITFCFALAGCLGRLRLHPFLGKEVYVLAGLSALLLVSCLLFCNPFQDSFRNKGMILCLAHAGHCGGADHTDSPEGDRNGAAGLGILIFREPIPVKDIGFTDPHIQRDLISAFAEKIGGVFFTHDPRIVLRRSPFCCRIEESLAISRDRYYERLTFP